MITLDVAAGVTLALAVPDGAIEEPQGALPAIDVSAVPGARVAVRRGFTGSGVTLRAACVVAPSDRWAPGLEELVLGRATAIATANGGASRWEPGPIERKGDRFEQRVTGRAGDREIASVRHVLGFAGEGHDAVLCSIFCGGDDLACSGIVAAASVTGPLTDAPPPSLLVRAALLTAERPYEAALSASLVIAALVALLVARRPKVPGRRYYP